jgi:hypothetical protein
VAPKAIAGSYTINVVLGGNAATITPRHNLRARSHEDILIIKMVSVVLQISSNTIQGGKKKKDSRKQRIKTRDKERKVSDVQLFSSFISCSMTARSFLIRSRQAA